MAAAEPGDGFLRPPHMRALLLAGPLVLVAGCGAVPDSEPVEGAAGHRWRWESYAGIELQVPGDYGWRTTGSPLYPAWCADIGDGGPPQPGVNRGSGSVVPLIGCPADRPVDTYAPAVDLGSQVDGSPADHGGGWVSETVEVAGVPVTVSDDDADRRQRILSSVRQVDGLDAHGCPPDSLLLEPAARPSGRSLPSAADLTGVAVCRYALAGGLPGGTRLPKPILSSSRLDADQARGLLRAIRAAPEGGGPDSPSTCSDDGRLGEEMVVLRFTTSGGVREVTLRYSGCDGHGIDDGRVVRRLTAEVLKPVLTGPHEPSTLSGAVARLL